MIARQLCIWVAGAALATGLTGCVRRTVTIRTEPQGATVLLNDQQVGTTPLTVDFTWYGDYDVVLRKEGYETLQTHKRLQTPWYELPGLDFISEVLVPFQIHDKQEMSFAMEPRQPVDKDALLKDATEMRDRTLFGTD
jgi:hypothetical protein